MVCLSKSYEKIFRLPFPDPNNIFLFWHITTDFMLRPFQFPSKEITFLGCSFIVYLFELKIFKENWSKFKHAIF